jgi:hypothetical protein
MYYFKSIFIFIFFFAFSAGTINTHAQPTATKEQTAEIQKLIDEMNKLKKGGKGNDDPAVVELAKKAIKLADDYYKIPNDNLEDKKPPEKGKEEPEYAPGLKGEGEANKSGKKVHVKIGPDAFSSPGWLASSKLHEIGGHGNQAASGTWPEDITAKIVNILESEAYDKEIANAKANGLSDEEIAELKKRRKAYYDALDKANQDKINQEIKDGKRYETALKPPPAEDKKGGVVPPGDKEKKDVPPAPPADKEKKEAPSEKSQDGLKKATLYIAGTVLSNERMQVSVRSTRMIEGVVIQTEVNGKKSQTRTDANGKAMIDFAALTAGMAGTAVAIIKTFDPRGKEISSATTNIQPGSSMIFNRPAISKLPANISNAEVVTIPGQNLGADAQLVCGDQIQQTLSASDREMTVFTDAATGLQPAFVITPNGVSQSQNVNIYSLDFVLPKSSINTGEIVNAQVHYASIPVGTKLIFTNNSPQTVKMNIPGGQTTGNTCTYTVNQPNNNISINVTGINNGGFKIALDLNFDESKPPK